MSKRLLWGMITLLLVTNIASIILLTNKSDSSIGELDGEKLPKEVAVIGDKTITAEMWMEQLQKEQGKDFLKNLINHEVVFQLADQHNITVGEKWMERELSIMETTAGVMSAEERQANRDKWKKTLQYQIFLDELLTRDVVLDESEMQKQFNEDTEQYNFAKSYQLSHIVVSDAATADKVVNELEGGASFSILAREYSIDHYTKAQGGYLGYFSEDNSYLQNVYFDMAKELEPGTYSIPFQTGDGTVILYLHHILPELSLQYEDVKNHLKREAAKDYITYEQSPELLWDEIGVEWIYDK
ncbi:foldase protein PrsA [Salirhabdus euzebyi]|uniref:peptidylprolyl isomerase n=1 Tax=Salirhabdus euzebyi TaxID=394506 RepID=A0A841QAL5_9BACI|nr:peptidylprolyl isomerase [Salirhabdus euzebyi]MBB6455267.1 foldase protein PrsA [Salirhabdus euzebyi]